MKEGLLYIQVGGRNEHLSVPKFSHFSKNNLRKLSISCYAFKKNTRFCKRKLFSLIFMQFCHFTINCYPLKNLQLDYEASNFIFKLYLIKQVRLFLNEKKAHDFFTINKTKGHTINQSIDPKGNNPPPPKYQNNNIDNNQMKMF